MYFSPTTKFKYTYSFILLYSIYIYLLQYVMYVMHIFYYIVVIICECNRVKIKVKIFSLVGLNFFMYTSTNVFLHVYTIYTIKLQNECAFFFFGPLPFRLIDYKLVFRCFAKSMYKNVSLSILLFLSSWFLSFIHHLVMCVCRQTRWWCSLTPYMHIYATYVTIEFLSG